MAPAPRAATVAEAPAARSSSSVPRSVTMAEATIDTSGGSNGDNNYAGNGRVIAGSNVADSFQANVQGTTIV